jgi:hypothetical protein
MQIKQINMQSLFITIQSLKKNEELNVTTKYKLLKLESFIMREEETINQLIAELGEKYGEKEEGGRIKIKDEYIEKVQEQLDLLNNQDITLPDIYFSLDEFEASNISWQDLQNLYSFIK